MNKKKLIFASGLMMIIGFSMMVKARAMGASGRIVIFANGKSQSDEKIEGTVDISEFDTLTIDADSVDVFLEEGDEYKLEYYVREEKIPEVTQDGKSLTIKEPKGDGIVVSSFEISLLDVEKNSEYRITVPRDTESLKVDIRNKSEVVRISDVDINGKVVSEEDDVYISNSLLNDIYVKSSDNNVILDNVKCGNADIEAYDDITINIAGKNEYSLDLKASCSDDIVVGDMINEEGAYKIDNPSGKSITAKTSSGDINITFSE